MQSGSGWHGIPWVRCQRCGTDTPSDRVEKQRGLILCRNYNCVDNPLIWERDAIIQQVLSEPEVEMAPPEILVDTSDDNFDVGTS